MDKIDCLLIGAGVVGLAIARELAKAGREVVIVERNDHFGMETSSRNSEVIHAGIYYGAGSLKARLCVEGKKRLYRYCDERNVPYQPTGKLIVATQEDDLSRLNDIRSCAHANGVDDVDWMPQGALGERYPELNAVAALYSPSTGIVDSHQFMLSLLSEATEAGAFIAYGTSVTDIRVTKDGIHVTSQDTEPWEFLAATVINSAGINAQSVARNILGLKPDCIPQQYLAKGNYFSLTGAAPVDTLVYPVPSHGGLGIHLSLDLAGCARFGPDVQWVDHEDYALEESRREAFEEEIRRYWPGLPSGALQPAYSGIRPKLNGPGEVSADFRIDGPKHHGIKGLVNLFGIESPGLTASLAIAGYVRMLLADEVD